MAVALKRFRNTDDLMRHAARVEREMAAEWFVARTARTTVGRVAATEGMETLISRILGWHAGIDLPPDRDWTPGEDVAIWHDGRLAAIVRRNGRGKPSVVRFIG